MTNLFNEFSFLIRESTDLYYLFNIITEIQNNTNNKFNIILIKTKKKTKPVKKSLINFLKYTFDENKCSIFIEEKIAIKNTILFTCEYADKELFELANSIHVITQLCDYSVRYKNYIKYARNVFFIDKYFSDLYNYCANNKKNKYLGSPKYPIENNPIKKIDNLIPKNFILILYPRWRDLKKVKLRAIYKWIKDLKYNKVLKFRAKEKPRLWHFTKISFDDITIFPHTSQYLIRECQMVINFGSTAILDIRHYNKPCIDIKVKPFPRVFDELYNHHNIISFDTMPSEQVFKNSINKLMSSKEVIKDKKNYQNQVNSYKNLFLSNSSSRILEEVMQSIL